MQPDTIAVILGGGKGTRLYPLTHQRSKPAVPFAGKFRLIDVPISNCINSDIKRIFVLTQYNSESLNRHINRTYQFDHFSKGFVSLLAAEQTPDNYGWFQGTADAIRQMIRHIASVPHKYILVLSGDQLYRMDYRKLLRFHKRHNASLTISAKLVSHSEAESYGILQVEENSLIHSIVEKPNKKALEWLENPNLPEETPFHASMGVYMFDKDCLITLLEEIPGHDLVKDIIPPIIKDKNAYAYSFDSYWKDIGLISTFYEVNLSLTDPVPDYSMYDPDFPIYTRPRRLAGAKIHNSRINSTIISEGSIIDNAEINRSIIGIRSIIRDGAYIENSIIMGADFYELEYPKKRICLGIGENTVLKRCIVDKNVRIGKNVKIINKSNIKYEERNSYYIRDGIVIIPKETVIPNDTVI